MFFSFTILLQFMLVVIFLIAPLGHAQARTEQGLEHDKLKGFAALFVDRVGGNLERYEAYEANLLSEAEKEAAEVDQILSSIPDGETLLLRPKFGTYIFDYDLYVLKQRGQIYFSFEDMVAVLDLAIDYDPQTQTGSGWFLREDWDFEIDIPARHVKARGKDYVISPDDIYEDGDLVFVQSDVLGEWLSMDLSYDLAQQYAFIESSYPLPEVARNARLKKKSGLGYSRNLATLPRYEADYKWLDMNTAAVNMGTRYRRPDTGETTTRKTLNLAVEGQALKHQAYMQANMDNAQGLSSATARLFKRSEDPDLLGPLHARSYVFGDTDSPRLPLTGNVGQELGFRVDNNPLVNADFEKTRINGDALPGWDVELYRNGILVDTQTIDDDGRYDFDDVLLFAGDNDFEIFFYGPQGEIRSELLSIPVTASLLATQKNTYDMALTFNDTRTYRKTEIDDVDKDQPHFVGRYNTFIGDTLAYAGLRSRSIDGTRKLFVGAGLTTIWGTTLIDANTSMDEEGNAALAMSARRSIAKWDMRGSATVRGDGFSENSTDTENVQTLSLSGSAQRKFAEIFGVKTNVLANASYNQNEQGNTRVSGSLGTGAQYGRYSVSNNIFYEDASSSGSATSDTRLEDTFSVRANWRRFLARGGLTYEMKPDNGVQHYFSQVSYQPTDRFMTDFSIDHRPENKYTNSRLNLNYRHDNFRLTPYVAYDSDKELITGANVNFNVFKNPQKKWPEITSDRVLGNGLVSAFVFLDKDGNLIFDGDDEILPNVVIESLNVRRRAPTDEKGYALIKNLPTTQATDIRLDPDTLPDSFMISGFEGVSLFPRAGEMVDLEFPVHMAGEIDGFVYRVRDVVTEGEDGSEVHAEDSTALVRAEVSLISLDQKYRVLKASTALDGFYVLSQIPPGRYMLTVSLATVKRFKVAPRAVRFLEIGYDGDILYGQDMTLDSHSSYVQVTHLDITQEQHGDEGYEALMDMAVRDGSPLFMLSVGKGGQSRLMDVLQRFAIKRAPRSLFEGLEKQKFAVLNGQANKTYYMFSDDNSPERLYERCSAMMNAGLQCQLEVIRMPVPSALKTAQAQ